MENIGIVIKKNNQKSILIKKENFEKYLVSCKFSASLCLPTSGAPDFPIQKLQ